MADTGKITVKLTANTVVGHNHQNAGTVHDVDVEYGKVLIARKLAVEWSEQAQADAALAEVKRLEGEIEVAKRNAAKLIEAAQAAVKVAQAKADAFKTAGAGESEDDADPAAEKGKKKK